MIAVANTAAGAASSSGVNVINVEDALVDEAAELDGYFSDTPLDPKPKYPPLRTSFDSAVVITGLPKVPEAKLDKLSKVVHKLVSRIGNPVCNPEIDFNGILMPFDKQQGSTYGFCFVEYENAEVAKNAVEVLQGYSFDKKHQLRVASYERSKSLKDMSTEEFQPPEQETLPEKPNAMKWLEDPDQRDSFIIRYQRETAVFWCDAKSDPVLDYDGAKEREAGVQWCEYYCHWSPSGSYLATLVPSKGVILWSGENYEKTGRFVAQGVKVVLFSPLENYLLTNNEDPNDPAAIKVYHIPTGSLLRAFPLYPPRAKPVDGTAHGREDNKNADGNPAPPPPFLWSYDDKYLARMGEDLVSIYETPTMMLLESRSFAAPGVREFQWSPSANIIAYWAPEAENVPAHVDLIEIPSRKKLRQKNLFNVTKCNLVFHPHGGYLAVKVTRHTKSKKTLFNNIELFRLNEPGVPVEMLDTKDAVMALVWEPMGSRFAMIHAENPSAAKVNVSFYDLMKTTESSRTVKGKKQKQETRIAELNKVETLEGKQCNFLSWSPAGSNIIMASLGDSASGTLEFYDVDNKTLVIKEHYRANQVLWDPAGRSVATVVSQPIEGGHFKFAMDNGYILWSFQGKQLYQQSFETFYQFLWRPRKTLLSAEEIEKVKRNLKKYEKRFDRADSKRLRALYLEETKGKRAQRAKFRELLERNKAIRAKQRAARVQILHGYDSDNEANFEWVDITVETVLTTKEEIVM